MKVDKGWMVHNSQNETFRRPFGAVQEIEQIQLELHIRDIEPETLVVRVWEEGKEPQRINMVLQDKTSSFNRYMVSFSAPNHSCLLWYDFEMVIDGNRTYYGNNRESLGGEGEISPFPIPFQITVYKKDMSLPKWFREGIIYQIFVDRFYNGSEDGKVLHPKKESLIHGNWNNTPVYLRDCKTDHITRWDFFGGNLAGIIKKLSYLQDLGASILYLNPIFEAPSNHKYDTGDYHKVDPMFGDENTLKELCDKGKEIGFSVVLDGVFSHTGADSVYFNRYGNYPSLGAYQSVQSPYYSWYWFKIYPEEYDSWWGIDTLPNVKELDPGYQEFIITGENSVLNHWMDVGIKGWRLDVADELPGEFIQLFKSQMLKKDQEGILIGEVWEDASNKISYSKRREYLLGQELDSVTNYPFRAFVIDFLLGRATAQQTHKRFMNLYENYPLPSFYGTMNIVGSHDVPRILTVMSEKEDGTEEQTILRTKLGVLWQMTFPGVPCVYYGDEAGVTGGLDPLNRKTYPWGDEDQELLKWYKKMIRIRKDYPVFVSGTWKSFYQQDDVYGFIREIKGGKDVFGEENQDAFAMVVVNRNEREEKVISMDAFADPERESINVMDLITQDIYHLYQGNYHFHLKPLQGAILMKID